MMEVPFPAFNHTLGPYTIEDALGHQQTQPQPVRFLTEIEEWS
jgi:hypothetical protein